MLAAVLLVATFAGCSDKGDTGGQKEKVDVVLRVRFDVSGLTSRATDEGTAWERRVNDLRIFVFRDDGLLEEMLTFQASELTGDLLETTTVVMAGEKTFVLTGNEPGDLTAGLDNAEYLWELEAMELTTPSHQYTDGLPFVTLEKTAVEKDATGIYEMELALRRAVSKAELRLIKSEDNYTTVEVANIDIVDTPSKSALLPGDPLTDTGLLTTVTDNVGSVVLSTDQEEEFSYYLYEHITGAGDAATNRATRIRLELLIDGVSNIYIIPLVTVNEALEQVNDITRNTLYRLDVLVHPYSIFVDYNIYAWNWDTGNDYDKELGGGGDNGSFYSIDKWIEAGEWEKELPIEDQ